MRGLGEMHLRTVLEKMSSQYKLELETRPPSIPFRETIGAPDELNRDAHWRWADVSGDGTNNAGRDVKLARDETLAKGIVINGLVILSDRPVPWNAEHTNPPGGLGEYYKTNVIGGPGAFVVVAENFNSFGQAIVKKLIAEAERRYGPVDVFFSNAGIGRGGVKLAHALGHFALDAVEIHLLA